MAKETIILAAGGTGGHIFPALATMEELKSQGFKVIMIVDEKFKKFHVVDGRNIIEVPSSSLKGGIFSKITKLYKLIKAIFVSASILLKEKPKYVIGFGGYPSFPPCIAAMILFIPVIIHEQNAVLGLANQCLLIGAKHLATSFKNTLGIPNIFKHKATYTGNPVRAVVEKAAAKPFPTFSEKTKLKIIVIGGSQGASIFSKIVPPALVMLPEELRKRVSILQQCRESEIEFVKKQYDEAGIKSEIASFFKDIAERFAASHLVIARSGASTIAEIAMIKRASILVPLPSSARNHQFVNAESFAGKGYSVLMEENKDFTSEKLRDVIISFFNEPTKMEEMASKIDNPGKDAVKLLSALARPA